MGDTGDFEGPSAGSWPGRHGQRAIEFGATPTGFLPHDDLHDYEFLVGRLIDRDRLRAAAVEARRSGVAPHEVIIARGWVRAEDYVGALAARLNALAPAEPAQLGNIVVIDATAGRPAEIEARHTAARRAGESVLLLSADALASELPPNISTHRIDVAAHGMLRTRPDLSAASPIWLWQSLACIATVGLACGGLMVARDVTVAALTALVALPFLCVVSLRLLALAMIVPRPSGSRARHSAAIPDAELPIYSVLVPLFREADVLPDLVKALSALDYPRAKLDVVLILEEVDQETIAAARRLDLPGFMRLLVVPDLGPRTKPKALNFALFVVRGSYVVVFDAEDIPDPGQLRKALALFAHGGPDIKCVQARLNVYNARATWLTRQFTLEYSALFDGILPALSRLGLPLPLGGTSNHFPRRVLEELGGWDPHNVTEDADLGIRIARSGGRIAVLELDHLRGGAAVAQDLAAPAHPLAQGVDADLSRAYAPARGADSGPRVAELHRIPGADGRSSALHAGASAVLRAAWHGDVGGKHSGRRDLGAWLDAAGAGWVQSGGGVSQCDGAGRGVGDAPAACVAGLACRWDAVLLAVDLAGLLSRALPGDACAVRVGKDHAHRAPCPRAEGGRDKILTLSALAFTAGRAHEDIRLCDAIPGVPRGVQHFEMSFTLQDSETVEARERSWQRVLRIAGTRPLRDYIMGRLLEMVGKWMFRFTNGWVVWTLTESPAMVGFALFCLLAPAMVIEPIGGVLADRYDKKRVLGITNLGAGLFAAIIAWLAFADMLRIEVLLVLLLAHGAIGAFSHASSKTIVAAFVPRQELPTAVALNSIIHNAAGFVGPAIAGNVIWLFGAPAAYALCAGMILTFLFFLRRVPPLPPEQGDVQRIGFVEAIRAGLAYVLQVRLLCLLFVLHVSAATLARPFIEFIPAMVTKLFAGGPGQVALVTSAMGIGSMAGGLWLAGRDHAKGLLPVALGAMPILAMAMVAFVWSPVYWLCVVLAFVAGFGMISRNGATQTMLQLEAGPGYRGRVVALYSVTMEFGAIIGGLFTGLIAEVIGLKLAMSLAVALALMVWAYVRDPLKLVVAERSADPAQQ